MASTSSKPARPDLLRASLLFIVVFVFVVGLLIGCARLATEALMSDAAQDVDYYLSKVGERLSKRRSKTADDERPPGLLYNASGRPAWINNHDANATFFRLLNQRHWKARVLRMPTRFKRSGAWGSWVVLLENFTTADEASHVIDAVGSDWRRAKLDGAVASLAYNSRRSDVAFCNVRDRRRCGSKPELFDAVGKIMRRVESAIGISSEHFEATQLLRYKEGDHLIEHHDTPPGFGRTYGVRMLTAFLYLSDLPEGAGGETAFPLLPASGRHGVDGQLAVAPRVGRLLVWPNVRDDHPARGLSDMRMVHMAKEVKRGVKHAANIWVHLFRAP